MNSLVVLPIFFAAACAGLLPAGPIHHHHSAVAYSHHAPAVVHAPAPAPAVVHHAVSHHAARSQFHAQDGYGTYSYGYAEPNGAKKELRHPDGTVTGTYSHPLPDGRVLTNNYVADEHGFRSNLAPTAHKDFSPIVKASYSVHAPVVAHSVQSVAVPQPPVHVTKHVSYAAPVHAPAPAPVPVAVHHAPAPAPVLHHAAPVAVAHHGYGHSGHGGYY